MELLTLLVLIVAGGLFGYRQWLAIREQHGQTPLAARNYPPASVYGEPPHLVTEVTDTPYPPTGKPPVSQGNFAGMNKYVIALLCAAWIISPFDFDFVPVVGWADDVVAAVIGLRALIRS
jgi:hypothetical protein